MHRTATCSSLFFSARDTFIVVAGPPFFLVHPPRDLRDERPSAGQRCGVRGTETRTPPSELLIAMTGRRVQFVLRKLTEPLGEAKIHLLWSTSRYEMRLVLEQTERVHAHVDKLRQLVEEAGT